MPSGFASCRSAFPLLSQKIDGQPIVYLDSAATTQKPKAVLDAMRKFYEHENANPHRGMHILAERATVKTFINAKHADEVIFTRNTTEGINLVATSWGQANLKKGDAVLLTMLEHHSNIVPWLQLKEKIGINVLWADINDDGSVKMEDVQKHLKSGHVKMVAVSAQSNVLGTRPDLKQLITLTHDAGAVTLIDAAQYVAHAPTDVQDLDCDFLAFSGHKLYGPMGIGVLYGKHELLNAMPPFLGGGMMIGEVTSSAFTCADLPHKFEAGTQAVAEAVGLAAAIDWLTHYSWKDIAAHERALMETAFAALKDITGLRILGPQHPNDAFGCLSFVIDGVHPHDLTEILGRQGICLRAGHHCAQPLHKRLGIPASSRVSMGSHNTVEEISVLPKALTAAIRTLRIGQSGQ